MIYTKVKFSSKVRSTFSDGRGSRKELKPFGEWRDRQRKQFNNPLPSGPAVRKAGQEANGDSERLQGHEKS
jgi:hypothetical protein